MGFPGPWLRFGLGLQEIAVLAGVILLTVWSMVWKGIALWKAARRSHLGWYVVLLVVNTAGILEIIYIYVVANRSSELLHRPA